MEMLNS